MEFELDRLRIALPAGRPLHIRRARGGVLRVTTGRVWLTESGSPDDVFLDAGAFHRFDRDTDAVLTAESASASVMFDAPLRIRSRRGVAATLASWFGWSAAAHG